MLTAKSKKNVSLLLAICMIAALFFAAPSTSAATASGTTGDCTWTLDGTHLTISGNGYMENYWGNGSRPWGKAVTSVTVEQGVKSIGSYAFEGCKRLTSITIPDSVTSIGSYAFEGCTGLTSITIPDGVTNIDGYPFSGCANLKDVYYTGDLSDWCKIKFNDWGSNPMSYATNLYINGKLLEGEITIPDDITSVGNYTFHNCTSLTSITIPDSVIYIDENAFYGCTSLTKAAIGNGVTSIDDYAFSGCTGLTNVTIGNGVTSISDNAFSGCTWLTTITVDENNINYSSVVGVLYTKDESELVLCPKGKSEFTIPDSVTSIGDSAFEGCKSLTSITIPNSVASIGDRAFIDCTRLKDVYYTGNLSDWCKIEFGDDSNPMRYATNLYINGKLLEGEITIPDDVTSIGGGAFHYCTSLTSVTIPDSVTSIGNSAFANCTGLTNVTIGNSVTSIGGSAFYYCASLNSITIPSSVTSIGGAAFYNCNLKSIIIPDSVTSIGIWAFDACRYLTIKTPENSTAHKYAVNNNIKYELIEPVTVEDDDKNITISTDSSVIPSTGVSLSTEKVENIGEKYETQLKNLGAEKFAAYNIDLMKAGAKIQPDGKVTVSIAVPDGMDGAKCKVYRAESDGTLTDMKASLNDGKLTFTTDHFSLYIITQSAVKLGDVNGDGGVTIKDAIAILRHNAEVELLTGSQIIAGDLNGDGTVNTKDAILLLQYNAQIIDKFPIE